MCCAREYVREGICVLSVCVLCEGICEGGKYVF